MSAIDLNARASSNFEEKLAETQALLQQAALDYAPLRAGDAPRITLACSLGAEDMVLAHLINSLQLDIGIFVLETGQLHAETLALLDRLQATSRAPVQVFAPVKEAAIQFVAREGKDAMYQSIALRKACCAIRKMEPLSRALAGKDAWITGLRREQSGARAEVPLIDRSDARPTSSSTRWPTGPGATCGSTSLKTRLTTTRCTTSFTPASAARPAPALSAWAKTFAPAAGGGKTKPPRNAACTSKPAESSDTES